MVTNDRSLLTYYCYNILSRIVGLLWLSWSHLWSDAVLYDTRMRSNVPRCDPMWSNAV